MDNSMAKGMTKRYEDYLHTTKLEKRAAKSIYYWVMSTLEFLFWTLGRKAQRTLDFFASEEKMFLVFRDQNGEEHEIVYIPTENCGNEKLPVILQDFVEIFNTIKHPLGKSISSPIFCADYSGEKWCNDGKYKDFYYVCIYVDMLPDANND